MPDINADEILTLRHHRNFIQFGGPKPSNKPLYAGQDSQYLAVDGATNPESGKLDPLYVPDPNRVGKYRLIGRSISAPDLPSMTIKMREKHGSIPRQLARIGCQFTLYEAAGGCADLSDFAGGWSDYVLIYSGGLVTDKDLGKRSGWDEDDAIEDSLDVTLASIYPIGPLNFGETAAAEIDREVVDAVYGTSESCGDCAPAVAGDQRIYAVTKSSGAGSPGYPAELIYSLNGGVSWTQVNITGMAVSEDPLAIAIAGRYLIILAGTAAAPAYYYTTINATTGVPSTFTKITTGLVANKAPQDIYVSGPNEIFLAGTGGYIYKIENVPSGASVISAGSVSTQNLSRIHGAGDVIVATGANGTILKSLNRGRTFAATTASVTTTGTVQAVWVFDKLNIWVGTDQGRFYYTLDGGESWTENTFPGSGVGQVYDIVFPTREVGYVAYTENGPTAKVLTTWNGGYTWTKDTPRISNMPTFTKCSRIAVPTVDDPALCSNSIVLCGLSGGGVDGIIVTGYAAKS